MVKEIDGVKRINNCQELLWGAASDIKSGEDDNRHNHPKLELDYECSTKNPELCGKYHNEKPSEYYGIIQKKCRKHDASKPNCDNNIFCQYDDDKKCIPKVKDLSGETVWNQDIMTKICSIEGEESKCKVDGTGGNPNGYTCTYKLPDFSKTFSYIHLWSSLIILSMFIAYTCYYKIKGGADVKIAIPVGLVSVCTCVVFAYVISANLDLDLDCNRNRYPQFIEGILALYIILYYKNNFLQKTYVKVYAIISFIIILGIRIETTLSAGDFGQEYNIINMFPYLSNFFNIILRKDDHNNHYGNTTFYSVIMIIIILVWTVLIIKYPDKLTGNWTDTSLIIAILLFTITMFYSTIAYPCKMLYEQSKENLKKFIDTGSDIDLDTIASGGGAVCYAGKINGSRDYEGKALEVEDGEIIDIKCKDDYEGGGTYKCVSLKDAVSKYGPKDKPKNSISVITSSNVREIKNYLPWKTHIQTLQTDCDK